MEDPADNEDVVDLRKPIDKNLPDLTRISLSRWCATWKRLKESGPLEARDQFALTGHYTDPATGTRTRARMDFHDHRVPDEIVPTQLSDLDSVLGIVRNHFPIVPGVVLKYFMLLSPSHTLEASLHLPPVDIQDGQGPDERVHLHRVPNGRFMEMEPQALIRIFFPRAERGSSGSNCLTERKLELLYDLAVRPAALAKLPQELTGSWPPTWSDERFRAENMRKRKEQDEGADHGRQIQHTGRDVHSAYLNEFVDHMRTLVNTIEGLAWAKSFFFVCEMRGMKTREGSMHPPPDQPAANDDGEVDPENPRVQAVDQILQSFDTTEFEPDHWFIDLGITFMVPSPLGGYACPLPAVEAHASILAHVLEKSTDECMPWVQGRGGHYQRDELAQLHALAGFRFTNPEPESNGIYYVQLYTSDKAAIYNLNLQHHAKRVTAWEILKDWDKVRKHHYQPLLEVFKNGSAGHEMNVRLEVRVEFTQYPYVQLRVPARKVRTWVYCADPKDYWGWKLFRLESIYSVLRIWMDRRRTLRRGDLPEACSLFVSLVGMTNALVNRPDDGTNWEEIRDAGSVHGVNGLPVWPLKAQFLHTLIFSPRDQPRSSSQRTVSIKTILYVCSIKKPALTENELHALIADSDLDDADFEPDMSVEGQSQAHLAFPVAVTNKQRTVKAMSKERQDDLFSDALPEAKRARRYDSEDEDYEERAQPDPLSLQLTDILTDLPVQIIHKSPHQKARRRSWCALEMNSPLVSFNIFNSQETLERAFPCRTVWTGDIDKWNGAVNRLLPTRAEAMAPNQGLHTLEARKRFIDLQRDISKEAEHKLLEEARHFAHTHWVWLPYGASKGHLWATGTGNTGSADHSVGEMKGGPWIILNPHLV